MDTLHSIILYCIRGWLATWHYIHSINPQTHYCICKWTLSTASFFTAYMADWLLGTIFIQLTLKHPTVYVNGHCPPHQGLLHTWLLATWHNIHSINPQTHYCFCKWTLSTSSFFTAYVDDWLLGTIFIQLTPKHTTVFVNGHSPQHHSLLHTWLIGYLAQYSLN